jgi:hypothetical protein
MNRNVSICYSDRDQTVATEICTILEAGGLKCWLRGRDVPREKDLGSALIDSVLHTQALILIPPSNDGELLFFQSVVQLAVRRGVRVVVFRATNAPLPPFFQSFHKTYVLNAFADPTWPQDLTGAVRSAIAIAVAEAQAPRTRELE